MVGCSIRHCKSRSVKGGEIRFFSIPSNESVAKEWLRYCGPKTTKKNGRVCSNHFLSSDYSEPLLRHVLLKESPKRLRTLKPDVIPTLYTDIKGDQTSRNMSMSAEEINPTEGSSDTIDLLQNDPAPVDNISESSEESNEISSITRAEYNSLKKAAAEKDVLKNNLKKIFTKGQIHCLTKPKMNRVRWSEEDMMAAFSLKSVSARGYRHLRSTVGIPLPAFSTLRKWASKLGIKEAVKTTVIYPATEKHLVKYSQQEVHIVLETPELYEKLTLPHIEKEQFNLQWIYNILEGKTEQDRIVHNNSCDKEGFVLLPDLKWDGVTKETLYLLAIVRERGLKSLRDLNETHLPLLKRVRDEGKKKILEKYNLPESQLRIYFHYQPSFYHLHIHFTYLRHEAPGIYAEKAHLLSTVINNIEMMSDYYQKASLPFKIREMDSLFNVYETNGYIQRVQPNIGNTELIDK